MTKIDEIMVNKTFKNNKTGEIVKVIDAFENIAILENKGKEYVNNLLNPNIYTEVVDMQNMYVESLDNNFLNIQNTYSTIAEQIKNIPINNIKDGEDIIQIDADKTFTPIINEPAILQVSEDYEREELMKKYGVQNDVRSELEKQNESFSKLLDETPIQKIDVVRDDIKVSSETISHKVEDPIITMFRNVKRNQEFSINIEIKNKIPRPDFIELMEDSYNYSIIEFLAHEFADKILNNPKLIEDMIIDKIKEIVYGAPELKKKNDLKDYKEDIEKNSVIPNKKRGRPKKENS